MIPHIPSKTEISEILCSFFSVIPSAVCFAGVGIITAEAFHFDSSTGMWLTIIGAALVLITAWLRTFKPIKSIKNSDAIDLLPLQPEIDQAYREGFKVWFVFPNSSATRKEYLDKLRAQGYLITDQNGQLQDTLAELNDTPTRRRNRFRVVEYGD